MDGLACSYLATLIYKNPEIHYLNPGQKFPVDPTDREVVIADFSFSFEEMEEIHKKAKSVVLYDHHKSALPLVKLPYCHIDESECGASLMLKKLCASGMSPRLEAFIEYVKDHDLWLFKEDCSKAVRLFFRSYPIELKSVEKILDFGIPHWGELGKPILRYQENLVNSIVDKSKKITLARKYEVPVAQCSLSNLISEVGHQLALKSDCGIGCTYFDNDEGQRIYSLRSLQNVSALPIAQYYGGGGHDHACGFSVPLPR